MKNRYASLDTLRAVAIGMVFIAHLTLSLNPSSIFKPLQVGGIGVDLFFLLSGWLLGNQLFKELREHYTINVKRFLLRRWFRTLPAYYFVLLCTIIQRIYSEKTPIPDASYLYFLQNYSSNLDFFYVSWSLCVEEQFYLIIAPLLLGLNRLKQNTSLNILFILICLPFFLRHFELFSHSTETHGRMDCCIAGILLAKIRHQHTFLWKFLAKNSGKLALGGSFIGISFLLNRWLSLPWLPKEDPLLLAIIFGSWMIWCTTDASRLEKLSFPGVRYIAERSYAIYLIHPEALAIDNHYLSHLPSALRILIATFITLICAEAVYRGIERPFMLYRDRNI